MSAKRLPVNPEEFTGEGAEVARAAIVALEAVTAGHVIYILGCDDQGVVWLIPRPEIPYSTLREAFRIDLASLGPAISEHFL